MKSRLLATATALIATLALAQPALARSGPTEAAVAGFTPDGGAYHLYRLHRTPGANPAATTVLYYGGPVIPSTKVAVVLWGPNVNAQVKSGIDGYFQAMTNSTYVDQLAQYSTKHITGVNGDPGTNQKIVRGSYLGQFQITPGNTSTTLTDRQVQRELRAQIAAGAVPARDLDTLYMIYFPPGVTISLGQDKSCVSFGAYHEAVSSTVSRRNIFYGVMPDCGGGFTSATIVSSHEFAEATTDAIPTPGSNPAFPQAWNTSDGFEIGDLCEGHITTLTAGSEVYRVQELFTNDTGACATGKFTSP